MIDNFAVVFLAHFSFYLAGLLMAAIFVSSRTLQRHLLDISQSGSANDILSSRASAPSGDLFRWVFGALVLLAGMVLEALFFASYVPTVVEGLVCTQQTVLSFTCNLDVSHTTPSLPGALFVGSSSAVLLWAATRWSKASVAFPLAMFAAATIAFGVGCDLLANTTRTAQGSIAIGMARFLQIFAAIALAGATLSVRAWSGRALVAIVAVGLFCLLVRLAGSAAILLAWRVLPSGTAIAFQLIFVLLPGVALSLLPIALAGIHAGNAEGKLSQSA